MDREPVTVRSYANIAIIKYWGKKKEKEMVPATSSISLTLENMYTETTLSPLPTDATADVFYINGQIQNESEHAKRVRLLTVTVQLVRVLFVSILKTTCLPRRACPQVLVVCLPWSRLAMPISSLAWIEVSWRRKLSLPQVLPLGVFMDH